MRWLTNKEKEILKEIALLGGMLVLAVAAPNAIQILRPLVKHPNISFKANANRTLKKLQTDGLVTRTSHGIVLTESGAQIAQRIMLMQNYRAPCSWDGLWRVIAFDVPESYARGRVALREALHTIGFVALQKSVYVFPHDCRTLINLIAQEEHVSQFITYFTTSDISSESHLLAKFDVTPPNTRKTV